MTENALPNKYRPPNLEFVIGHGSAVTRLQGIAKRGKVPNALGFFGPPSVGKTTLARAFAASVNGVLNVGQLRGDYIEINGADQKSIEDVRQLIALSKFKPSYSAHRVIVIDEAHQILTNKQAAQALLKPIEEPSRGTIWVLCSMDPDKFDSTLEGRAILTRLNQFILAKPTDEDMLDLYRRIIQGESMSYLNNKSVAQAIIQAACGEMRTMAQIIQSVQQYYDGLPEPKPAKLTANAISPVVRTTATHSEDTLVLNALVGVYTDDYQRVVRALLDVTDYYMFAKRLMWANSYMLGKGCLEGESHQFVRSSVLNRALEKHAGTSVKFSKLVKVNSALVELTNSTGLTNQNGLETTLAHLHSAITA
jgi:DNA polymerase III delta prime subunit